MKRSGGSIKLCALLLALMLLWRVIGAPLSLTDFENLKTPLWQARILLPQRAVRMLALWISARSPQSAQTMGEEKTTNNTTDEKLLVYLTQEDRLVQMTLEGYVCGVVAAEMPAQYHLEALKAQAVAARTRVLWQQLQGGCALHPGADICTDSTHCQGYATLGECRQKWGASYEAYRDRLINAEQETAGQWIAYEDKPITVLYHASSGGKTENVQTVFAEKLPYLVSVESEEDETASGFQQELKVSFEKMAEQLGTLIPDAQITPETIQRTFAIGGYTESGRVSHMMINGKPIDAVDFRNALGLRSTLFSMTMNEDGVSFYQRGYGHGVGMSQTGANQMAASGKNYVQILKHYYTGVDIVSP